MLDNLRRLHSLLGKQERQRVRRLLVLMAAVAVLEALGVFSVMPFLALVANPAAIDTNRFLAAAYANLGFTNPNSFLIAAGVFTLAMLTISNAVRAFATWYTYRVVYIQEFMLSSRLLSRYAAKPYDFFHAHNTSELIKNILSEVNSVVHGVMLPLLQLIAKAMVVLLLAGLLIAADPWLAVALVTLLGGAYAGIYGASHALLSRLGKTRADANGARFRAANHLLGGIKEIQLYRRAGFFLANYDRASAALARAWAATEAIAQLPRFALEVLAFGGGILIVLYLLSTRGELDQVLPLVGLYALAGYRLMPAFQQIFSALTSLRFHDAALSILLRDAGTEVGTAGLPAPSTQVLGLSKGIEIQDLTYYYGSGRDPALAGITMSIRANSCIGVVGSTGSGKSTLLDLIAGLLRPQQGSILVDGEPLTDAMVPDWQRAFGYVPQQIYLTDDSIARNIAFGLTDVDMDRVRQVAIAARLDTFVQQNLPDGYDTLVGERGVRLSGGERQRIGIARALYHNPAILVFDEATAALDNLTEAAVMQAISDLMGTKTLIIVAHRLATVRQCDHIFLLEGGKIAASGTYARLLEESESFRAMVRQNSSGESA